MDGRKAADSKLLSILQYGSIDEANADKDMCSEEDRFGAIRTLLSLSGTSIKALTLSILGNLGKPQGFQWTLCNCCIISGEGDQHLFD